MRTSTPFGGLTNNRQYDKIEIGGNVNIFFDTETTGIPKDYYAPASNVDNWPRLIQIGWVIEDLGFVIDEQELLGR